MKEADDAATCKTTGVNICIYIYVNIYVYIYIYIYISKYIYREYMMYKQKHYNLTMYFTRYRTVSMNDGDARCPLLARAIRDLKIPAT